MNCLITLIMKASTVPSAAPLASSASTMGMMPAALVYTGTPMMSTPGVVIDGKVVHAGGVPKREKVEQWLAGTPA